MTREAIRDAVLRALGRVAPEADASTLDPAVPLREQLDIDSMDFLNIMIAIHKELGVSVPESDYAKLATLAGSIDYLTAATERLGQPTQKKG